MSALACLPAWCRGRRGRGQAHGVRRRTGTWLVKQRWFAGKGRTVHDLAIVADTEIIPGDPSLRHLIVAVSHGATSDCYQLFVGLRRPAARPAPARPDRDPSTASRPTTALHDTRPDQDAARRDRGRRGASARCGSAGSPGAELSGHQSAGQPGQPGAHRRAEQHQPGVRRVSHPQGVPPGRPRAEPGPGGGHGADRAGLHARRRAARLDRDQAGGRAHHAWPSCPGTCGRPPTAGRWPRPASATCTRADGRAARARSAATSPARPNGSASPPPRCTPTWRPRSAPTSWRPRPSGELAERMFRRLDMAIAAVPELAALRRQDRRRLLRAGQAGRARSRRSGCTATTTWAR